LDSWFFVAVGALAQLVDGSLGMGFGMISSTLLITIGTSAAVASASVHLAEIGTTLVSGFSHWKRNNVDFGLLKSLAIPGSIGAFIGANFLASLDLTSAKNLMSVVLFGLGFFVLYKVRFARNLAIPSNKVTTPLVGLLGGFVDAASGGGWGPITTPVLISATRHEPRKIVGTVSAAEFLVAISATFGFLLHFSKIGFDPVVVLGLALGGMVAAPFAAKLVSVVSGLWLGTAVGLGIILINGIRLFGLL
jgi:uncharacterized protein